MFALWKHSQQQKPHSYQKSLDGQDSVFYMPKGTQSQQISVIENHLNCRAVLLHREKVTCFKCFFRLFPNFEPKCELSISPPVIVEKRTNPEDQLEKMRLHKTIKRLNRQVSEQSRCIARLTLQHRPLTTESCSEMCPKTPPESACLFSSVLEEMTRLFPVSKHGRRFTQQLLDLSQLLFSLSPRAYKVLRQIFVLPTLSTLYSHYGCRVKEIRNGLVDVSKIDDVIREVAADAQEENGKIFTLAVDAFAFRSFCGQTLPSVTAGSPNSTPVTTAPEEDQIYSNGFMFLLIPLSCNKQPKLLHIAARRCGNYDDAIDAIVAHIKGVMALHGLKLFFKATDGDRFLTKEHSRFFTQHICALPSGVPFCWVVYSIYELLQSTGTTMPIADPLHFSKNARAKLLKHPIVLQQCHGKRQSTDAEQLRQILNLGKVFEDKSSLGAMRDRYVIELFHLSNVAELLTHGVVHGAFLLLPYAALFAAIFEPSLENEARLFFIEVAYHCYWHFLTECPKILRINSDVHAKFISGVSQATTLAEESYIVRMIHTCIALAISLVYGPRFVRMDALGTHLVENRIGNARAGCNDPRWSRILSNCSLAELRRELAKKYKVIVNVSKRVNHGGAKVDTLLSDGLVIPESWRPELIVSLFIDSLNNDGCVSDDLESFAQDLMEIAKHISKPALGSPSDVANSSIMARNISFGSNLWRNLSKTQDVADAEVDDDSAINTDDEDEEDVRDEIDSFSDSG